MKIKPFVTDYLLRLKHILDDIDADVVSDIIDMLELTLVNKSRIYIIGNGGSSATASHMVNDLGAGLRRRDIANFDVVSLGDNSPVVSAIANDIGYENIFINQLKIHYRDEDILIVISASGNSPNVLKAAEWVKSKGGAIIGFLGFNGGNLIDLCDVKIHFQSNPGEYGPVEDSHLIMNHILAHWFQNKLK